MKTPMVDVLSAGITMVEECLRRVRQNVHPGMDQLDNPAYVVDQLKRVVNYGEAALKLATELQERERESLASELAIVDNPISR